MYELIQVSNNSYYIDCPAKIGVVRLNDADVVIIDSGNDKDTGKKVKKILDANGWRLTAIFNTHSHADHIGGNRYLQTQTGCKIYAAGAEKGLTEFPVLEPSLLYGGNPPKELRHKFFMAEPSKVEELTDEALPNGMQSFALAGHCFDMVGFRTSDDVVYLADCLASAQTLEKYKITYIVDVEAYLKTLDEVSKMSAACFVPSHAEATEDIAPLCRVNIDAVNEIGERIADICSTPQSFDALLARVFEAYQLRMTPEQHALVGSTVRSYLTYLKNRGTLTAEIENNIMRWKRI